MKFLVSMTYSRTTPESVEIGDFSDTGFIWEDVPHTFRELVELLGSSEWFYEYGVISNGWDAVDYLTSMEQEDQLHVKCPTVRHMHYFGKALKLAGKI